MPVDFTIRAELTRDTVQISPGKIEFGTIYENSGSQRSITFDNLSALP